MPRHPAARHPAARHPAVRNRALVALGLASLVLIGLAGAVTAKSRPDPAPAADLERHLPAPQPAGIEPGLERQSFAAVTVQQRR